MGSWFYTNRGETRFIDKLKHDIDRCRSFSFSVSFIKKPGLKLIASNIRAALERGACGRVITSTYQNFTDVDSLQFFHELQVCYPERFACRLDRECFHDAHGDSVGFHSKGYLFEFADRDELLVGSSNITVYALLKNVEWDVSIAAPSDGGRPRQNADARALADGRADGDARTLLAAKTEFEWLWDQTLPLTADLIDEYKTRLFYSIERWDMDYEIANSQVKPNYMQRKALKELNRIRAMGAGRALVIASAGSGKTFLAAFDALNFNPRRLLYIAHEGSILEKAFETFRRVFGNDRTYGLFNGEHKDQDADFVFSTNVTMAASLELFDRHLWDYVIIDECHHATARTYQRIIEHFEPQFLLGITATPERMDGGDVLGLFDQNVPYELRLRDAIINRLVVPFKYYGIRDELIEYGVNETKGHRFVEQFSDDRHCDFIHRMIEKHRVAGQKLKALAFCRDVSHAIRMAQAMEDYYGTRYLTGKNSVGERLRAYRDLQDDAADLEILFTVDILNEGVDIPGVNMVLFLRPTDSQTVFIQQLGRGLRVCEGKRYVTVLDFIGNDYKRSVQIAFALGSLSEHFLVEKKLVACLVKDDFASIGLGEYGVEIHLDDLSKKEILSFIDEVNFNTKVYLEKDYQNFKGYLRAEQYPRHVDYLNNDAAPNLIKFMQSRINGRKTVSYLGFLQAIGETGLPSFDERQEGFVKYVSEMLPIVRPYEYLMIQALTLHAGSCPLEELERHVGIGMQGYERAPFEHALKYMLRSGYFRSDGGVLALADVDLDVELAEYLGDLLEYGLGRYEVEFTEPKKVGEFCLWAQYRKEQVQLLLLNNPRDIMLGTKIYDGVVYAYVTVVKANSIKDELKYADGYIDENTFQWETVAAIGERELENLKGSVRAHVFVRKVDNEDGIQLPFTYIGPGRMEYIEGSKKPNGAHLFHIAMEAQAPMDVFYDFKLP